MNFLFWIFLVGIVIACFQDIRRREVDNWLNLLLIVSGFTFLFFSAVYGEENLILSAAFLLLIMFFIAHLFYHGRIFSGGDAKLLFALTPFFVEANFFSSLWNIGVFSLLLLISGSIYGMIYSTVLYLRNSKKVNKKIVRGMKDLKLRMILSLGILFIILGYFSWLLLFFGVFLFLLPVLYLFARSLDEALMIKTVSGKELREGDLLFSDVRIGKRIVKSNWEGLSKEELRLLKNKKSVKIRDGLPFAPAFLIAFLTYVFLSGKLLGFLFGIF